MECPGLTDDYDGYRCADGLGNGFWTGLAFWAIIGGFVLWVAA